MDPELKKFAQEVNGPLMQLLAERVKYHDIKCVDLFKTGAPLVGKLPRQALETCVFAPACVRLRLFARTGNGKPHDEPAKQSVQQLREERLICVCMRACVRRPALALEIVAGQEPMQRSSRD
jgi:hypothetical protein